MTFRFKKKNNTIIIYGIYKDISMYVSCGRLPIANPMIGRDQNKVYGTALSIEAHGPSALLQVDAN